jgi:hypothetical protein
MGKAVRDVENGSGVGRRVEVDVVSGRLGEGPTGRRLSGLLADWLTG